MTNFAPLLPLLIPSFSSKGNLLLPGTNGKYVSDNYSLLQALDIRVSKSYLVSAYDVYYGFMPQDPNDWPETDYLFIDSGGYETNDSFDLGERNKFTYCVLPWDNVKMKEVYSRVLSCPKFQNTAIVLSGFDTTGPFEKQLAENQSLVSEFPGAIIDFIIKMSSPFECLLSEIIREKQHIGAIPIIGLTEKELGCTVRDRLLNLILLKRQLVSCGWVGNIHVFGGLEPNLAKLYYIAGADIFDGLSWQRMYYRNNASLYDPEAFCISLTEHENKYLMMVDNLSMLQEVGNNLAAISERRLDKMDLLESYLEIDEATIKDILILMEV